MFFSSFIATAVVASTLVSHCQCSAKPTEGWRETVVPCQNKTNINSFFENLQDKTRIHLAECTGQNFELTYNVHVSEVKDLQITANQATTVSCSKANITISFEKVSNLLIDNLHILNCGASDETERLMGGLNIINCSNVTIESVQIAGSLGSGLTLVNNNGIITVNSSTFRENGLMWTEQKNIQSQQNVFHESGGGMQVVVKGGCTLIITNCKFFNNHATNGGGLFLMIHEEASGQQISVLNSTFGHNDCHKAGGGVYIGFSIRDSTQTHKEAAKINVQDCTFSWNRAEYGGGVAIFSILSPSMFSPDTLTFTRCNWTNNSAVLGQAVDIAIAPGEIFAVYRQLPSPVFADCRFVENGDKSLLDAVFIINKPRSTLFVAGFRVEFRGLTVFEDNLGSAIETTGSSLNFTANSTALFVRNTGIEGGAWSLKGLTTVYVNNNSYILFKDNRATHSGGAIFMQYYDKHSLFISQTCFIQYVGESTELRNLTLIFSNNTAAYNQSSRPLLSNISYSGDSLWITSFTPCIEQWGRSLTTKPMPFSSAFHNLGNITFESVDPERVQIITGANHFTSTNLSLEEDTMCLLQMNVFDGTFRRNPRYNSSETNFYKGTLHLIPGKKRKVPLKLVDDFCTDIFFHVQVQVISSDKHMYIDSAHSVITDNYITIYGDENQSGEIQLSTSGFRTVTMRIRVFLDDCPPGYKYDNTFKKCSCSATEYHGLSWCKHSVSYLTHGFWVGYLNDVNSTKREDSLATTLCPKGFCTNNTKFDSEIELPSNASEDISKYVCNANRTGLVCGKCRENHSVCYHSSSFACRSNDLCHLGWLFYILSELIPVTLFFLMVIILNISFTSGPLNGVIFFMQFVDTLKIKAENFIWFGNVEYFTYTYKLVFRMFSLKFFSLGGLSFCLWSGASALDMMAFRYVTIVFSFLLTAVTVAVLKLCNIKRRRHIFNLKGSIIHGLSAFLVISYSECTRVSLMILTRGILRVGPKNLHLEDRSFAFYNGEYSYLGQEHIKYALLAIFFIMTIVSIPPLLLISYPLCYKLFALLRVEETKCVQIACKIFPLEKMKPLFDSFQGAFKDHYRFFAGLYFIYRLSSLVTFSESFSLTSNYYFTGLQLVIMLVVHTVCRPYKKSWHNVLDTLLFFNLSIINGLAYYNYYLTSKQDTFSDIQYIAAFQTVLILLPLVYLCVYTGYCIVLMLKKVFMCKKDSTETNDQIFLQAIDARSIEESCEVAKEYNYELLKQSSEKTQEY